MGLSNKSTYVEKEKRKSTRTLKQFRLDVKEEEGAYKVSYTAFEKKEKTVPVNKCQVTEPVFVNPCGYDAVIAALKHIGEKSGIPKYNNGVGSREWVAVCCDGSPYNLCFRVMMSTYRCSFCPSIHFGLKDIKKHITNHNIPEKDVLESMFSLEFDWVFLHPGPGHVEMNMLKGITELCWDAFWKNLAQLMNFTSEKALLCCKRVSDHHKGWTLATIAREAISCELVLPFVREQLKKGDTNLSAVEFAKFLKNEVKDNT